VAPSSIIAWLWSPGSPAGSSAWARGAKAFAAEALSLKSVASAVRRERIRTTLPSTQASGAPQAMLVMAAAV